MTEDRIERDILIEAPLAHVWTLVAQPGFWVGEEIDLPGTVAVEGETTTARNATYGDFPVRVVKTEPPSYLAYRWASAFPGEQPGDGNSTLIEFTLTEEGTGTRLKVVESGFATLAGGPELRGRALEDNTGGWQQVFDAFKKRAEQSAT
ncbi:SRPBCC domain-containing protein [Streptomyces sp. NPDC090025]|uniref:SRPBCC domain-containing protein n=1 Tax=Streptomyces sp. NPDC090025 TaxID=3365922 RepID=UPI003834965E